MKPSVLILTVFVLFSCKSKERIVTVTDTEYRDRIVATHDTAIIRDSVLVAIRGDTVFKEKYLSRYVTRYVHDTLSVILRDSVAYPVEVPAKLSKSQQYRIEHYARHVALLLMLLSASVSYIIYIRRKTP